MHLFDNISLLNKDLRERERENKIKRIEEKQREGERGNDGRCSCNILRMMYSLIPLRTINMISGEEQNVHSE